MENYQSKIFTKNAIITGTFFGGPLVAGFLMAHNFKVFGKDNAARKARFIGAISTIILLTLGFVLPDTILQSKSGAVLPIIYTGIISVLLDRFQKDEIDAYFEKNGPKASSWIAIGSGLLVSALILLVVLLVVDSTEIFSYDKFVKVNTNITLYYGDQIEDSVANDVALNVQTFDLFETGNVADLFLVEQSDSLSLYIVTLPYPPLLDSANYIMFKSFENSLRSENLKMNKSFLGFVDPELDKFCSLEQIDVKNSLAYADVHQLNTHDINFHQRIFYNNEMPVSDVKVLAKAIKKLKGYFPAHVEIEIVFINSRGIYELKFFVNEALWHNPDRNSRMQEIVDYIKWSGIKNNIQLILVNNVTGDEKYID